MEEKKKKNSASCIGNIINIMLFYTVFGVFIGYTGTCTVKKTGRAPAGPMSTPLQNESDSNNNIINYKSSTQQQQQCIPCNIRHGAISRRFHRRSVGPHGRKAMKSLCARIILCIYIGEKKIIIISYYRYYYSYVTNTANPARNNNNILLRNDWDTRDFI